MEELADDYYGGREGDDTDSGSLKFGRSKASLE
jgi:hypothetical protein